MVPSRGGEDSRKYTQGAVNNPPRDPWGGRGGKGKVTDGKRAEKTFGFHNFGVADYGWVFCI
jgi:hypothetical protein